AVDHFGRLAAALARSGAPFDIVAACASIPSDEVRHSDLALRAAALCAGNPVAFEIDPAQMEAEWPNPMTSVALDRIMVELPPISATLALLSECRARVTDPVLLAVYRNILADELHHARLGWYYLAWRAPQWSRDERQQVADRAGELVMAAEQHFFRGRDAPRGSKAAAR